MNILEIGKMLFGLVFILFLPGLIISYALYLRKEIDVIERIGLSFALSIAVVPLVVFYLNLLNVKINELNIILEVLGVILVAGIIWYWRKSNHAVKK